MGHRDCTKPSANIYCGQHNFLNSAGNTKRELTLLLHEEATYKLTTRGSVACLSTTSWAYYLVNFQGQTFPATHTHTHTYLYIQLLFVTRSGTLSERYNVLATPSSENALTGNLKRTKFTRLRKCLLLVAQQCIASQLLVNQFLFTYCSFL